MAEEIAQVLQLLAQAQEILSDIAQPAEAPPVEPTGQPSIGERFAAKAEEGM